jgi:hypothetical protein
MNVEVIKSYQRWAEREYVTALTCKNHTYHRLIPVQQGDGVMLLCPREDYQQQLGLADYLAIKRKVEMAEFLWKIRSQ